MSRSCLYRLNSGEVITDPAKYRRRQQKQLEAGIMPDRYAHQVAVEKLRKLNELEAKEDV
jgi:hypothetical protein